MQPPVALGDGERVGRQREVVHADVDIVARHEAGHREAQHRHALRGIGQRRRVDATLRLEARWQVGVGIERDAVGPQRGHARHGVREARGRLARQAVDQVGVDRGEAEFARVGDQGAHLVERLNAVHGLLDGGVEVLHAEADAVEPAAPQVGEAFAAHGARIDLDGQLRVVGQVEGTPQRGHEAGDLRVGQEGRRAAPEVQLRHAAARADRVDDEVDLALQRFQVRCGPRVVLRDDLVAGAVVADRFAERNVHVDGQRRGRAALVGAAAFGEPGFQVARAEGFVEAVGGRIGGVARPGPVDAGQYLTRGRLGRRGPDGDDGVWHGAIVRPRRARGLAIDQGSRAESSSSSCASGSIHSSAVNAPDVDSTAQNAMNDKV